MFRVIPVLAACALCGAAAAQTVYKCNVNGKVTYGDHPCASGATVELAVPAAPAGAPAAGQELARARAASLELEKLRMTRELREEREQARLSRAAASLRQKCDRLRLRHKWANEDLVRTEGPKLEAARLKTRRQAEALAVECPA
jgi:hypothetical protein